MRKTDKRIEATKTKLRNALLELRRERRMDSITISLICERAKVNRNTFYSHYSSVEALVDEVDKQFLDYFTEEIRNAMKKPMVNSLYDFFICLLTSVKENSSVCSLIFNEHSDGRLLQELIADVFPMASELWSNMFNIDSKVAGMIYRFIVGGAMGIIEDWIKNGYEDDIKDVAKILNKLIINGQSAFMNC